MKKTHVLINCNVGQEKLILDAYVV